MSALVSFPIVLREQGGTSSFAPSTSYYKEGNDITLVLKESIWEKNKTFIKWLIDTEKIPAYNYFVGLKRFCDLHKRHAKKPGKTNILLSSSVWSMIR